MSLENVRTLIVEDDRAIVRALKPMFSAEGASVTVAETGRQAATLVDRDPFDLLILDLGLPDMDGRSLIPDWRERSDVPIIVLSAHAREEDRVEVLDLGADDFVAKPYSSGELLARVRAALRRRTLSHPDRDRLRFEGLEIDLRARRAIVDGEEIRLSGKEHALLCFLGRNAGRPVTHRQLIDAIWGKGSEADSQFVRVLVGQLRHRIEADPAKPRFVRTEPGIGYRLDVAACPR